VTSTQPRELRITAVRHGETTWNSERLIQGHTNSSLNAEGREQALKLAESLRRLGFDYLVTSDLDRAKETATIIGEVLGLTPSSDPLLRERCFGELEGLSADVLTSELTGLEDGVYVNPDARPPGGESFRDVVRRAQEFIERADAQWPAGQLLVVTHGGMVQALRAAVSGQPLEETKWFRVGNCTVWTF
jgi:2,3-bisphosphoglycerate-dependent phosphoglycerate mutase